MGSSHLAYPERASLALRQAFDSSRRSNQRTPPPPAASSPMAKALQLCMFLGMVSFHVVAGSPYECWATRPDPYASQVASSLRDLDDLDSAVRAGAAERLGFLRAYSAQDALVQCLHDDAPEVRRAAALALAWCGDRFALGPLLASLRDSDWLVRQSAHVALINLTGMEFPFDAAAIADRRREQELRWRDWLAKFNTGMASADLASLLDGPRPWHNKYRVTASTTYKGPPSVVLDGELGPAYWQVKGVPFPQHITVDLGKPSEVNRLVIHQYGPRFVMTDYEVSISQDNESFESIVRARERSAVDLVLSLPSRSARYIRITSYGSANPLYPMTLRELEINDSGRARPVDDDLAWRYERGLRALGCLGQEGSAERIRHFLGPNPPSRAAQQPMVTAGIRSLGRIGDDRSVEYLIRLLDNPMWARRAAEALGDCADARAVQPLITAFARYAKRLDGENPREVPADDRMTFPSEDRMLETPYCILYALCRHNLDTPATQEALRELTPLLLANQPGDHDTFFLYEPEPAHQLLRYLLDTCGMRRQAREHAYSLLETSDDGAVAVPDSPWPVFAPYRAASWLPTLCTDREDLPRLLGLLKHEEGWVRLNAAKAIAWLGDRRAIEPLAQWLREAPAEASYGYSGVFKDEEYADPAPRWREGLIRALGLLEAHEQTDLVVSILNDEQSVLEVRTRSRGCSG